MIKQTTRSLRDFYNVFTSGMSVKEIERLLNVDAREAYVYYVRHMKQAKPHPNKAVRFLSFCWNFFLAFLFKLTPARRLFYALSILSLLYMFYRSELLYGLYAFLIIDFLLMLEVADKLITKDELSLAREIQLSLLPNHLLPSQGYEIAAYSDVARSVGGDYYDLIQLKDGSSLVVVGDVSGKGISAALYMVKVQTTLQLLAKQSADPQRLLVQLNRYLYGQLKRNYFLTIALLQLYPDGRFRYCRAGHTPALHCDAQTRTCTPLQPAGIALGLAPTGGESGDGAAVHPSGAVGSNRDHHYEEMIQTYEGTLAPHDVMLLFTDGVVDTVNPGQQEFGDRRLIDLVTTRAGWSAVALKDAIVNALTAFRSGTELRDDTTFVVVKKTA